MKWTKEQFLEATKSLYRMKSLLYKVEEKYNLRRLRCAHLDYHSTWKFERKFNPLKRQIEAMERKMYLNMLHNGIEGEDNENPPSENKGKQTF